jgi:hypothetical protein
MTSTPRDRLIEQLQRVARDNGGRVPGEMRFYRETGLTKQNLWDVDIRSYGDLCELAGLPRNRLQQQMAPDQLFEPLAVLTARLKRFPDNTDRQMAHRQDAAFPSYEAYRTAQNKNGPLDDQLLEWCRSRPERSEAREILEAHLARREGHRRRIGQSGKVVKGYVYLFRYGNSGQNYKIGRTDQVVRRHSQISAMFPGDLRIVHVIETDDPVGIEGYWHRRFEDNLVDNKKEIFRLTPEDVAAFKWRRYQ